MIRMVLRMVWFWGVGGVCFMLFFEGGGIGGSICFIGFHFLEKLLDVFGFVFEEMHMFSQ